MHDMSFSWRNIMVGLGLSLICSAGVAWAADHSVDTVAWRAWSPESLDQARQEGRPVVLDLMAAWCRLCEKMDQTTYRDPRVVAAIRRHYVPVRADIDAHPDLKKRYGNFGVPATVILDGHGNEIIKRRGYLRPDWMHWLLEAVAVNPSPEAHR